MTVKERIMEFIKIQNLKVSEFEKRCNLSNGYVSSMRKSLGEAKLNNVLKEFPTLNRDWLLYGEGSMLKDDHENDGNAVLLGRALPISSRDDGAVSVRFFQVTPTATFQEFCEGMGDASDSISIVPPHGCEVDDDTCVFEIWGESMYPTIPNKARVLCQEIAPSKWHQIKDAVVAVAYGDKFVIKRVLKNHLASDNYLLLGSDNPDFPSEEKAARAEIRCVFRAMYVLSYPIS